MISLGEITSKKYSSFLRGPRVPILFWNCFSNYSFKYPNLFWYKEKCQITSSCASKIATLGPYPVLDTMCQYYFWIRSLISTKSKQVCICNFTRSFYHMPIVKFLSTQRGIQRWLHKTHSLPSKISSSSFPFRFLFVSILSRLSDHWIHFYKSIKTRQFGLLLAKSCSKYFYNYFSSI